MANIENINFNNIQSIPALPVPGVWTSDNNIDANGNYDYDYDSDKSVMALDIDWNGANWSSIPTGLGTPSEINTTADLLKAIKYAAEIGEEN